MSRLSISDTVSDRPAPLETKDHAGERQPCAAAGAVAVVGAAGGGWGLKLGAARPVSENGVLSFDFAGEFDPDFTPGEGWVEVGYVHENLFGSPHLVLLSSAGRSTLGQWGGLLGVQVAN